MHKPNKYVGLEINLDYVSYLEQTLNKVQRAVAITENWCADQSNGMTDGSICIAAMKDIRRHVKGL